MKILFFFAIFFTYSPLFAEITSNSKDNSELTAKEYVDLSKCEVSSCGRIFVEVTSEYLKEEILEYCLELGFDSYSIINEDFQKSDWNVILQAKCTEATPSV